MKLKLLYVLLFLGSFGTFSQNLIINFVAENEQSDPITLNEVIIDNLTTGKSITIKNNFSVNINTVLSVFGSEVKDTNKGIRAIYPNPISSTATIDFYSEGKSESHFIMYDIKGSEIEKFSKKFTEGVNSVKLTPKAKGVYFVKYIDNNKTYYSKILSTTSSSIGASMEYIGLSKKTVKSKVVEKGMNNFFTEGDVLRFTGISGSLKASIFDSPTETKTLTFTFTEEFYKFDSYLVETEYPSFVNILFSVTDKNNKGVDYLENTDFEVLENGNAISPSESFRYVKKLNQVPSKQRTVLMLDKSLSIRDNLPAIKSAALNLINQIADDQEISIYEFSDETVLLTNFTSNKNVLQNAINSIEVGFPSTNLYGSIITGLSKINNTYTLDGIEEGYLMVLTDGDDTQASSTLEQVIAARGNKKVFMVGLGSDLNEDNLNEIAFPGNYINAVNADELEDKFKQIRLDMLRFSNSFYWLNYMTPKRNSSNSLTVKAKINTNLETNKEITGSFSADGFVSVLSGVYANVEVGKKYGIDEIEFVYDGVNPIPPFDLKAVTYWAEGVPKFNWSIDNNQLFDLQVNDLNDSKAVLEIKDSIYGVAKILLEDINNNYTKEIIVKSLTTKPSVIIDSAALNFVNGRVVLDIFANINYQGASEIIAKGIKVFSSDAETLVKELKFPLNNDFNKRTSLEPNTRYFVQAYAENNEGIGLSKLIELIYISENHFGTIIITKQEEIDNFPNYIKRITSLLVAGEEIINLDGLKNIDSIGTFSIASTMLNNLNGLESLNKINRITFNANSKLLDINLPKKIEKTSNNQVISISDSPKINSSTIFEGADFEFVNINNSQIEDVFLSGLENANLISNLVLKNNENLNNITYNANNISNIDIENNGNINNISFNNIDNLGSLQIDETSLNDISFTKLTEIGSIVFKNYKGNNLKGFENLQTIRQLILSNLENVENLNDFKSLTSLDEINISSCNALTSIELPNKLINTSVNFVLFSNLDNVSIFPNTFEDINVNSLSVLSNQFENDDLSNINNIKSLRRFTFNNNNKITQLNLNIDIIANITVNDNDNLTKIILPNPKNLESTILIKDNNNLIDVNFSNLKNCGQIRLEKNPLLNDMLFPNLQKITNNLNIYDSKIVNLDGFSSLGEVVSVIIVRNTKLVDYCGLSSSINSVSNFGAELNAYDPTKQDLIDGKCKK